jgi:hypothetical protein
VSSSKEDEPVWHITWNRNGIRNHPTFKYALTLDERKGRMCNHPILGPEVALKSDNIVRPLEVTAEAAARLFETLDPITAPFGILTCVPIWADQGMSAGIDHMQDVPIDCNRPIAKFMTPIRIPPPVFPNGSLDQVLAAQDVHGPFFVVYKGFRVGVYTTYEHGAETAVRDCKDYVMHWYSLDYQSVCRMFRREMEKGSVRNYRFVGPVSSVLK